MGEAVAGAHRRHFRVVRLQHQRRWRHVCLARSPARRRHRDDVDVRAHAPPHPPLEIVTLRSADDALTSSAADVIVRSFAEDPRRRAPRKLIVDYLTRLILTPDEGVVLVGRLHDDDACRCALTIAFDGSSLDPQGEPYSPPPPGEPYIANVAVDARFRRRGYARAIAAAAAAAAVRRRCDAIFLHTEEGSPAHALFIDAGYEEVDGDSDAGGIANVLGGLIARGRRTPRTLLMRKLLDAGAEDVV